MSVTSEQRIISEMTDQLQSIKCDCIAITVQNSRSELARADTLLEEANEAASRFGAIVAEEQRVRLAEYRARLAALQTRSGARLEQLQRLKELWLSARAELDDAARQIGDCEERANAVGVAGSARPADSPALDESESMPKAKVLMRLFLCDSNDTLSKATSFDSVRLL